MDDTLHQLLANNYRDEIPAARICGFAQPQPGLNPIDDLTPPGLMLRGKPIKINRV
jgi:hypothetical protein